VADGQTHHQRQEDCCADEPGDDPDADVGLAMEQAGQDLDGAGHEHDGGDRRGDQEAVDVAGAAPERELLAWQDRRHGRDRHRDEGDLDGEREVEEHRHDGGDERNDHVHRQERAEERGRPPEEMDRVLCGRPQAEREDQQQDAGRDGQVGQLGEIHCAPLQARDRSTA
jgi:hypothetical protein